LKGESAPDPAPVPSPVPSPVPAPRTQTWVFPHLPVEYNELFEVEAKLSSDAPGGPPKPENYLQLVRGIAASIIGKLPPNYTLDELVSAGMIGLMDACRQFDPARGVPFERFAEHRIKGAIQDELRARDETSRAARRLANRVDQAKHHLSNQLGRVPSSEEIAKEMGMTLEHYQRLEAQMNQVVVLGFDDMLKANDTTRQQETVYPVDPDATDPEEHSLRKQEMLRIIEALEQLTPKEKTVVVLYYFKGVLFKDIAMLLDVTEGRISQLHTAAMGRLKKLMDKRI